MKNEPEGRVGNEPTVTEDSKDCPLLQEVRAEFERQRRARKRPDIWTALAESLCSPNSEVN